MSGNVTAIIPAAGRGLRMGLDVPKQFSDLCGLPILVRTVHAFHLISDIKTIILAIPQNYYQEAKELIRFHRLNNIEADLIIVKGGKSRQESVKICLQSIPDETELVLVHDGARPLVEEDLIVACIREARAGGAAMAAIPVSDTLKLVSEVQKVLETTDRQNLWQAQTPQVAQVALLLKAYEEAEKKGFSGTDEASLLEQIGVPVTVVNGSESNIKITRREDLKMAEAILMRGENQKKINPVSLDIRIGHGYDAHQLTKDRPLVLGGITIPHSSGLLGHSDADVLTHALCDAILGAAGLRDIGNHFPSSDQQYKNARSIDLLEQVVKIVRKKGYSLVNCDLTVIAQEPKLSPFLEEMQKQLADGCKVKNQHINIKATTTENMGFAGRKEGIAAHAVALLKRIHA